MNPTQAEAMEALAELVTKHTTNNVPEINRLQNILRDALTQSAARITELEAQLARADGVISPFAEIMNQINPPMYADNHEAWGFNAKHLMWGDFNRAEQWIKERDHA